jgi:hypothetical protein
MRKYSFILLTFIIFLLHPKTITAEVCDYVELARLKNIAENIEIKLSYFNMADDVNFSVSILNLRPGVYIRDLYKNAVYSYDSESPITMIDNYETGKSYQFQIYTDLTDCKNKELKTINIETPYYNIFYNDTVCNGLDNYYLCDRWYKHGLSYEIFVETVNTYKESLIPEEKIDEDIDNVYYQYIINFFSNTYYYFFGGIIIVGLSSIYYLSRKDDFDLRT